ncbi:unnamed protein product [Gongylonema pulchrum]|uniref:Small monomeric GTPase n=1 Tax=Gongylonema pulchrum TaxID=637853 RepID=A0A183CV41_9BILA|nr:unnamed protein product [Gongylonema pulchrum]
MDNVRSNAQFCWRRTKECCADIWSWLTWFTMSLLDLCGLAPSARRAAAGKNRDIERGGVGGATGKVATELGPGDLARMSDSGKKISGIGGGAGAGGAGTQVHKVIMVGTGGVGKSALTLQFMYDEVSFAVFLLFFWGSLFSFRF